MGKKRERKKEKGGAEKDRIKKRKLLESAAAKCAKLSTYFGKASSPSSSSTTSTATGPGEAEERGKQAS